jgi:hypothetical protein
MGIQHSLDAWEFNTQQRHTKDMPRAPPPPHRVSHLPKFQAELGPNQTSGVLLVRAGRTRGACFILNGSKIEGSIVHYTQLQLVALGLEVGLGLGLQHRASHPISIRIGLHERECHIWIRTRHAAVRQTTQTYDELQRSKGRSHLAECPTILRTRRRISWPHGSAVKE